MTVVWLPCSRQSFLPSEPSFLQVWVGVYTSPCLSPHWPQTILQGVLCARGDFMADTSLLILVLPSLQLGQHRSSVACRAMDQAVLVGTESSPTCCFWRPRFRELDAVCSTYYYSHLMPINMCVAHCVLLTLTGHITSFRACCCCSLCRVHG